MVRPGSVCVRRARGEDGEESLFKADAVNEEEEEEEGTRRRRRRRRRRKGRGGGGGGGKFVQEDERGKCRAAVPED